MSASDCRSPWNSATLLRQLAVGNEDAAAELFERYADRLTRLARSRLAAKLAARVDPEDIVLSAYRSFFVAARQGRFEIGHGGDLWRLLVEVALHKLYRNAERHLAQQRSVEREQPTSGSPAAMNSFLAAEPTPEDALAASEELEAVLRQLSSRGRHTLELRLQGYELEEIAEKLHCNERTVRRLINEARRLFLTRADRGFVPSAARRRMSAVASKAINVGRPPELRLNSPLNWSDYVLQEQIGSGATGKVYRASQKQGGPDVAIKFLRKSLMGNGAAMERFVREAHTVAALACPGIVAIQGAGQTPSGGVFLVMDLVRGSDLGRICTDRQPPWGEALRWVVEAANSLEFAHRQGVIHCDIKPSNLLIDESGKIRVTDFGMAVRFYEPLIDDALLAGTPAFMAPEQVDRCWGNISPRTDVWGLGAVLYFLLFGKPPHYGPDVPSVLASVVSRTPVKVPPDSDRQVPGPVIDLLKRCLAKSPDERIQSASALAGSLLKLGSNA